MSTAIVTGSAGLVGSEAVRRLHASGWDVIGIDNDMRSVFFGHAASTQWMAESLRRDLPRYSHHEIDVRSAEAINRLVREVSSTLTLVIHAAAQPSHDWAARDPLTDFGVNALGTLNLLEAVRQHAPDATFIFTSTNKVYGDTPNGFPFIEHNTRYELPEDHPWHRGFPESMSIDRSMHSLFGVSKASADLLVQEYARYFGMRTVVFRGGCLTGPSHAGAELHGFLAYLMKCVATGRPYAVYGYKGKQVRDNMHSRDLLSAFERVIADPEPGAVYNIGGGRDANCSVLEAMDLAQEIAGRRLQWSYVDPPRRGDHQWWISDLTAFRSRYPGWRVTYGIEDILREIYEENLTRWDGAQRGRAVPVRSRVAVIKLGSLGDVVRTTCLLPGIRRSTTGLEITWVTRADALPLLHGHPDVDRPVTIEDERREWRRNRYDWVISLDDDPEACRLASALSAKRLSGGYEDAHGHLTYTPDMAGWFGMGILRPESEGGLTEANRLKRENVLTYGTILYRSLGLPGPVSRPSFTIPPAALEQGRRCLARIGVGSRRVVGLSTGAGTRWEFKSWGELQTATLAHAIATEIEADVVILGGPAETERNRRIVALARHDRVVGAPTDLDVPTFAAVLASCDVLVSSDSLAVHLACGVQVPVVALFGPTSALEIDLYDTGEKIVTPLACRCCYLRTCDVRPHCMDSISVQRVLEAVARQLRHVTAGAPLAACQ